MRLSKYFKREEFECSCGCGFTAVDIELLHVLEDIREHFDSPVTITSGCRCATHNANVGGSVNSKHLKGIAADIQVKYILPVVVAMYLDTKYGDSKGIGRYETFTHIDVRATKARWYRP